MNTGLQDAYNLAWKLAYTIQGYTGEKILNTYQQERLPFAKQLMVSTDRAFSVLTSPKWPPRFIRMFVFPYVMPLLLRFRSFRRLVFRTVSQINISYFHSALTINKKKHLSIKAGQRLPYLLFNDGGCLYDKIKDIKFHLVVLKKDNNEISTTISSLAEKFKNILAVIEIRKEEKGISDKLGVKQDTLMLVRPDHYIAAIVPITEIAVIVDYFRVLISEDTHVSHTQTKTGNDQ
jgi:hypothetical protein